MFSIYTVYHSHHKMWWQTQFFFYFMYQNLPDKFFKKFLQFVVDKPKTIMYSNICSQEQHNTCASGSAVEHLLAKEGVAGSIPVSRSKVPRVLTKRIEKSVLFFRAKKWRKIKDCRHFEESDTNLRYYSNSLFIRVHTGRFGETKGNFLSFPKKVRKKSGETNFFPT